MSPRWTEHASDPNARAALAFRAATLAAARLPPAPERTAVLEEIARGKRVLDVGVVDHTLDSGQQLHRRIARAASHCLGIDILEAPVAALRQEGFNVRVCDFSKEPVGEQFEVVICGEVIEHLGDPAGLFRSARAALVRGGVLVVTTPNPFYLQRVRDGLRGVNSDNVDHVTLFSPSGLAELAEREGMRLSRYRGIRVEEAAGLLGKLALRLRPIAGLGGIAPEAFCNTLVYEFEAP